MYVFLLFRKIFVTLHFKKIAKVKKIQSIEFKQYWRDDFYKARFVELWGRDVGGFPFSCPLCAIFVV